MFKTAVMMCGECAECLMHFLELVYLSETIPLKDNVYSCDNNSAESVNEQQVNFTLVSE